MLPAPRGALAFAITLTAACASPPAPAVPSPEPVAADVSSASAPASVGDPAPHLVDDPHTVRCGVDDTPIDVLGAQRARPRSIAHDASPKAFFGFSAGASMGSVDLSRLPVQPNVPLAAGEGLFHIETLTRDGKAASPDEPVKGLPHWQDTRRSEDITRCGVRLANDHTPLTLEIRLTAAGVPFASTARGSSLDDTQSRCLAELGCRLSVTPADVTTTMLLRGHMTFVPPVFHGTVKLSSRRQDSPSFQSSPLLANMDRALLAAARGCVSELPPAASFAVVFLSEVSDDHRPVLLRNVTAQAAGALQTCLAPTYEGLAPVSAGIAPGTTLATTIVVTDEMRVAPSRRR